MKLRRQYWKETEDEIVRLHLAGASYREIERTLEISREKARLTVLDRLGERRKNKRKSI
jgi:hypothetical protein